MAKEMILKVYDKEKPSVEYEVRDYSVNIIKEHKNFIMSEPVILRYRKGQRANG